MANSNMAHTVNDVCGLHGGGGNNMAAYVTMCVLCVAILANAIALRYACRVRTYVYRVYAA